MFLFGALGSLMCSCLLGAFWQRDVLRVQTGTDRHCHFAAVVLCVACKSLFFLKRKKFQISFHKVRKMHAKRIKNLMEESALENCLCGKGYCHSRGLAWLCLDLVVLESDGALHQSSKIKALYLDFSLCSQVKGRGKTPSGESSKLRICFFASISSEGPLTKVEEDWHWQMSALHWRKQS